MANDQNQNTQALELAIAQLEREFGQGTVMRFDQEPKPWPSFSTGALTLDVALGIGGLPRGRIVEIYGPESSGKSTVCLNTIASAQKQGGKTLFVDAEHAIDPGYARKLGVNMDEILFAQPMTGEEGLEVLDKIISTGDIAVAVVDSVAALTPRAELEGDMSTSHVGRQARMMSQAMRKIAGTVSKTETLVIFTNQIREKIGVMYGSPETTPGGRALPFYASVRIDLRRVNSEASKDKESGEHTGMRVKAKIVKNKMAPPFRVTHFNINYGTGIDQGRAVVDVAVDLGIIKKKGAWYSYNDNQLGQGIENTIDELRANPDTVEEITAKVFEAIAIGN